jgi:hypothetical protein
MLSPISGVRLSHIVGAALLGVPAALLAHMAAFTGSNHTIGGAFHEALIEGSLAAVLAFAVLLGALFLQSAGHATGSIRDGSVLAAHLQTYLPSVFGLAAMSALWYGIIEALEPHHDGAPFLLLLAAFFAAAIFVRFLASAIVRALASIVVAITTTAFATHVASFRPRRYHTVVLTAGRIAARRLFARPPPAVV